MATAYIGHVGIAATPAQATARDSSSDEALIKQVAQRDQSAMRALFARHRVGVYRWLRYPSRSSKFACGGLPDVIRSQRSPYGTSLLGAGAVHHIRLGPSAMLDQCPVYPPKAVVWRTFRIGRFVHITGREQMQPTMRQCSSALATAKSSAASTRGQEGASVWRGCFSSLSLRRRWGRATYPRRA